MDVSKSDDFSQVAKLILDTRENVLKNINKELITLYWSVGKYISQEMEHSTWGSSYIDEMSKYITQNCPDIKGFNRRGLYRMKQFYETYKNNEFVSPLVTQISWTNHLLILSSTKSNEEREFYIKLCLKERYSKRDLQRQLDSGYYERYMLSAEKFEPIQLPQNIKSKFLDKYILEFLDLPSLFSENDFKKAITQNLKKFVLEFGKDFTFVSEEYRVQVGTSDYSLLIE